MIINKLPGYAMMKMNLKGIALSEQNKLKNMRICFHSCKTQKYIKLSNTY